MNIPNVNHYIHAYKIAPWRVQRQWIGNALLAVVALAMVSTLYLDVTSQAAIAGREPARAATFDLGFAIGPRLNAAGRLASS